MRCRCPEQEGVLRRDRALTRIEEHRRVILASIDEAESALEDHDPGRIPRLALIRWQMVRDFRSYQLFKHVELFDPMIGGGDVAARQQARGMKDRCVAIAGAYEEHVRRWSSTHIEARWAEYRLECTTLIACLRTHLEREGRELEQLLDGVERVRAPRAAPGASGRDR